MLLFHGSKAGIVGSIAPTSRAQCDFGRGFYMGTERAQALTLICNYPAPVLYELEFDTTGLAVETFGANLDWALFVTYNRKKLEPAHNTDLYQRVSLLAAGADVVCGPIANDRMFVVLERFFAGDITDIALVNSLSALQLGNQFVAKTARACERIAVVREHRFDAPQLCELRELAETNRATGIAAAEEICRRHRREGRFFDEIVESEVA